MKIIRTLACLSLIAAMASCAPAGYYDSTGQYRSYGASDVYNHNNAMSQTPPTRTETVYPADDTHTTTTVIYDRPGYYDHSGAYIEANRGPRVPAEMFPPSGMCRIWYKHRAVADEPPVESCVGIENRVPAGAYVIYGGSVVPGPVDE